MSVRFASLAAHDQPAVIEHLLALPSDDRVLRFNTTAPDDKIVEYCRRWNHEVDIAEGAWHGERLIGLIHLPVFAVGADLVGELGVSVDAGWRQRGIATRLTSRTFDRCAARGVDRIYINFLTRNRPMLCLARRFTGDIVQDGDETVAKIRIGAQPEAAAPAAEPASAAPAGSTASP
jgi:GNAT superfamily N-acetyltransferase